MTETLVNHGLLKQAAVIAKTFRIDPVMVLNSSQFEWQVRTAAHNYIAQEEQKEAAKIKKK